MEVPRPSNVSSTFKTLRSSRQRPAGYGRLWCRSGVLVLLKKFAFLKILINFKPLKQDDLQQVWSWQFVNQTQLEVFNSNPERSVREDWEVKTKVQETYLNTSCPHFLFTYLKRCSHLLSFKPRYKDTQRFTNKKKSLQSEKTLTLFSWEIDRFLNAWSSVGSCLICQK